MIYSRKLFFIFLLSFISVFAQNYRQAVPWEKGISQGRDLQIFLMEFSPGDNITDYFGHIALVVKDTSHNISRVYNFGLFSFDEGFIKRFAMGRLIFSKAALSLSGTIRHYVNMNRSILFHELNLPDSKKKTLAKQLAWEVLPENSQYLYHHYNDNCATRLRDLIDEAVDGQLKEFTNKSARFTLREHTLRYNEHDPLMQWLLMFLMNNSIDKPVAEWDEMFLPAELSRFAALMTYTDSLGNNQKLINNSNVYYDSGREPVTEIADNWPLWTIISGLIIGILAIIIAVGYPENQNKKRKLYFIYSAVVTLVVGFIGTVLFFMALFTDHVVTYHNENLLLANPLTLLISVLSVIAIFKHSENLVKKIKWLWFILAGTSLLMLILKFLPGFSQDNLMIISLLLPLNLGFSFPFLKKDLFKS